MLAINEVHNLLSVFFHWYTVFPQGNGGLSVLNDADVGRIFKDEFLVPVSSFNVFIICFWVLKDVTLFHFVNTVAF